MVTRRRPRAVLFDAGNTLLWMDYGAIAAQLLTLGVTATPEAIRRAEWAARVRLDRHLAEPGPRPSTESGSTAGRYIRYVLEGLGVREAAIVDAMIAWRHTYNQPLGLWTTPAPGASEALALVRAAGLGAAVISNSNGTVRSILESLGLTATLDFVIDSGEVGVEKPDARIFQLALDRSGVGPDEAAYIGDLYSIDVLGARRAGLPAVLLDPGGHWGPRDCPTAPDVVAGVELILDGRSP